MIDAAADVVVGHGPHVLRGIEVYKGRPIFYSLANFIFENDLSPQTAMSFRAWTATRCQVTISASVRRTTRHNTVSGRSQVLAVGSRRSGLQQ